MNEEGIYDLFQSRTRAIKEKNRESEIETHNPKVDAEFAEYILLFDRHLHQIANLAIDFVSISDSRFFSLIDTPQTRRQPSGYEFQSRTRDSSL